MTKNKIRIYALAKELKVDTRRLIEEVRRNGVKVSVPSNSVPKAVAERIRDAHLPRVKTSNTEVRRVRTNTPEVVAPISEPVAEVGGKTLYKREWVGPLGTNSNQGLDRHTISTTTSPTPEQPPLKNKTPKVRGITRKNKNVCPTCGISHVSRKALRSHALKVHGHGVKANGKATRPLRLVYTPVPPSQSASKAPKVVHKRICQLCALEFTSKQALRLHIVSDHLALVLEGKVLGKVKVSELSAALGVEQSRIKDVTKQVGLANDSSLPARLLREIVNRIRLAPSEAAAKQNTTAVAETTLPPYPPTISPKQTRAEHLSARVFDRVNRMNFGELRALIDECLRDRLPRKEHQSLRTTDTDQIRDYAHILATKVNGPSNSPSHKIVRRILEDIEIFERRAVGFTATTLNWRILPRGEHPFPKIIEHFQHISKYRRDLVIDMERLRKIISLSPDRIFVGLDKFEGYVVFYFTSAKTAVLDFPVFGNAIYVFGEEWKSLSRLSKTELLHSRRLNVRRIVHSGSWFSRLRSLVASRRH